MPSSLASQSSNAQVFHLHKSNRASQALLIVAFLFAGFFAVRNIATWPPRLAYPGEESYEGYPLADIVHMVQGVPIYAPGAETGFNGGIYGPLYYLAASRFVNPERPEYFPLRVLSMLGLLGCAACCGVLAYWLSRSYAAAFLAPLVFLSYRMTTDTGVSALSDTIALLLFFSAFLWAYRFRNSRAILLAAPLMCLGFYYKPQYIAGPLAVLLFLAIEKRYKLAAQFSGVLALVGFGLLGFFQWVVFPGQEFWRHFLFYQASLLNWHRFVAGSLIFLFMLAVPVLLSAEYLRRYPDKLLACYLACAILLGLATIGKEGSGVRYFFESVLLISAFMPALLAKNFAGGTTNGAAVLLFLISILCAQAFRRPVPQPSDFASNQAVQNFLRANFPAHSDALGVYPADLMQAGLNVPFDDLYDLSRLARRGKLSERGLVNAIRNQHCSVIVLDIDLNTERDLNRLDYSLTEPVRNVIQTEYELRARIEAPRPERHWNEPWLYVYVPRKARPYRVRSNDHRGGF